MFAELERKSFDLGQRMAERGFGYDDNPYKNVQPRLAAKWDQGYAAACAMQSLADSLNALAPAMEQPAEAQPTAAEVQRAALRLVNAS
jgi:hypothetical protein